MSESRTNEDFLNECWVGGLNTWEQQIFEDIEGNDDALNQRLLGETEAADKKLWTSFQNAAQCVAIMYKGATDQHHSLWIPFQTAAGNVTSLYKESLECMRKCTELGSQSGYQKRTRELANWARRKRNFRREDLLAFLSGKSPPPRTNHHFRGSPRTRLSLDRMSPRLPNNPPHSQHGHEDNLNTFREALGIHVAPPPVPSPNLSNRRRSATQSPELQSFICDEFARHKRPAPSASPSHDVTMDSPQHKRFKLT